MITMQEFVDAVIDELGQDDEVYFLDSCETDGLTGKHAVTCWTAERLDDEDTQSYFNRGPFAAVVYPDGSAQLLSRDEDECLLFATLWELEK